MITLFINTKTETAHKTLTCTTTIYEPKFLQFAPRCAVIVFENCNEGLVLFTERTLFAEILFFSDIADISQPASRTHCSK